MLSFSHLHRIYIYEQINQTTFGSSVNRSFATDAIAKPKSTISSRGGGGITGFIQRISSFFIGAGLSALATQYYIYDEIKKGNDEMIKNQKLLETRIAALEKK